jgi:hypothetical protein
VRRGDIGVGVEGDMVPLLFNNSDSTREGRKEEPDEG